VTADERLERRYRRLLACYPAAHRSVYAEEMLTVLMSGSAPEQRRTNLREAASLVVSGLGARLRAPLRAVRGPAWSDAAGVFGYVTCVLLAATYTYQVAAWFAWRDILTLPGAPRTAVVLAVGWAFAAVAAGLGWRRVGAAAAAVGTVALAATLVRAYHGSPGTVVTSWWQFVLAVAAVVSLRRLAPVTRPGRRSIVAVAVAALLVCVAALVEPLTLVIVNYGDGEGSASPRFQLPLPALPVIGDRPVLLVTMLVLLATLGTIVVRLPPATRRRVLLLATPAVAAVLTSATMIAPMPMQPVLWQWIALVPAPLVAFALGLALLARAERATH
jgi:hypothetical protein